MKVKKFREKKQRFLSIMIKMIQVLDAKVFKKTAKVRICNESYKSREIAGFSAKRLLFRILGFRDDYIIFVISPMWKNIIDLKLYEKELTTIAVHEVRHRFQHYNKRALISHSFAKENPAIDQALVEYAENSSKAKSMVVKKREFDAFLIGALAAKHYLQNSTDKDNALAGMVRLIKCKETDLLEIIKECKL